jgi:hypothetical protein
MFEAAEAYERDMGRWSKRLAALFVEFVGSLRRASDSSARAAATGSLRQPCRWTGYASSESLGGAGSRAVRRKYLH